MKDFLRFVRAFPCWLNEHTIFLLVLILLVFGGNLYLLSQKSDKYHKIDFSDEPFWAYTWFTLGRDSYQMVNGFYVSSISTAYKENGFQVMGIVGNAYSIPASYVQIKCAVKDTTISEKLTFGFTELPNLESGSKLRFSVFVPTKQTKVSEIGVRVSSYRM